MSKATDPDPVEMLGYSALGGPIYPKRSSVYRPHNTAVRENLDLIIENGRSLLTL
jgi:hypothetical protein